MSDKDTLYARWLNNTLTEEELSALKESGELESLEAIVKATESLSLPDIDLESSYDQLLAKSLKPKANKKPSAETLKAKKSNTSQTTGKIRKLDYRWAIAASLILAIAVWFVLRDQKAQFEAPYASMQNHEWIDGSSVVLNDGSTITYDQRNWRSHRILKLQGEAFFEVVKGNPFVVNTIHGDIEVLGTKFNVRAWGNELLVTCYEGSVSVKSSGSEKILKGGESVQVKRNRMLEKQQINHNEPFWMNGSSRFQSESITSVFQEIGRQYDISVTHPDLNRSFSGSFTHENLQLALDQVCKPMGISYNISDDHKVVTISE